MGEDGIKLLPIFLTMFFFILTMNLIGLVPGGHSATGSINVTAGLAIIAFFVIQLSGIFKNGIGAWLKHLTGGVHWSLWPIMIPVEILGLFTKPFALCMRLFANMTAGHIILLSLIGLAFVGGGFIPVTLGFSLFILLLELLVAFLQAYIFTVLTAVFTGMGMASHDHDHGAEHAPAH
jgi:F-type H+-transporting ATPase subunit a